MNPIIVHTTALPQPQPSNNNKEAFSVAVAITSVASPALAIPPKIDENLYKISIFRNKTNEQLSSA